MVVFRQIGIGDAFHGLHFTRTCVWVGMWECIVTFEREELEFRAIICETPPLINLTKYRRAREGYKTKETLIISKNNVDKIYRCKIFVVSDSVLYTLDDARILRFCVEFLDSWDGVLHPANIYIAQLLDHAFDASINLNKWEDALKYGQSTIKAYE